MSRDYDGPPIDASWSSDLSTVRDGETVNGTTEDDKGNEMTDWVPSGVEESELSESAKKVLRSRAKLPRQSQNNSKLVAEAAGVPDQTARDVLRQFDYINKDWEELTEKEKLAVDLRLQNPNASAAKLAEGRKISQTHINSTNRLVSEELKEARREELDAVSDWPAGVPKDEFSEQQVEIIETLQANPLASKEQVASEVGCTPNYVNNTKDKLAIWGDPEDVAFELRERPRYAKHKRLLEDASSEDESRDSSADGERRKQYANGLSEKWRRINSRFYDDGETSSEIASDIGVAEERIRGGLVGAEVWEELKQERSGEEDATKEPNGNIQPQKWQPDRAEPDVHDNQQERVSEPSQLRGVAVAVVFVVVLIKSIQKLREVIR